MTEKIYIYIYIATDEDINLKEELEYFIRKLVYYFDGYDNPNFAVESNYESDICELAVIIFKDDSESYRYELDDSMCKKVYDKVCNILNDALAFCKDDGIHAWAGISSNKYKILNVELN